MSAEDWQTEIAELHAVFEGYFLGRLPDDLSRVEDALAPGFSMVVPSGGEPGRKQVLAALKAGYGQRSSLEITTSDYQLLHDADSLIVAAYTESHHLADEASHRRATVVFRRDAEGPNGLRWLRVHETWIDQA